MEGGDLRISEASDQRPGGVDRKYVRLLNANKDSPGIFGEGQRTDETAVDDEVRRRKITLSSI